MGREVIKLINLNSPTNIKVNIFCKSVDLILFCGRYFIIKPAFSIASQPDPLPTSPIHPFQSLLEIPDIVHKSLVIYSGIKFSHFVEIRKALFKLILILLFCEGPLVYASLDLEEFVGSVDGEDFPGCWDCWAEVGVVAHKLYLLEPNRLRKHNLQFIIFFICNRSNTNSI